jgi:CheY-like chemotaxis protein
MKQVAVMSCILIVEDQVALRQGIAEMLRYEGFKVIEADDPADGFAKLEKNRPDLILSDLNFPGGDGTSFIAQIRQTPDFAEIPIIAVTGFNDQGHIDGAVRAGADGYLVKPVHVDSLMKAIRRHLVRA